VVFRWENKSPPILEERKLQNITKKSPPFQEEREVQGKKKLFIHFHRKMWSYEIESYSLNNRQVEGLKKLYTCSKKEKVGKGKGKEWFTFERENGGWREKFDTKCLPIPKKKG